jgi:tripeptidyl-peptidase-1
MQEHIDYITPGVKLLAPTKRGKRTHGVSASERGHSKIVGVKKSRPDEQAGRSGESLQHCDVTITPACIRALYGAPKKPEYLNGIPREDNSLGVFEEGDYYAQEDLDLFFANYTPTIPQGTHPIPAFIDGANAPVDVADGGGESALDFQLAYPILYPQTITLYQTDDLYYATNPQSTASGFFNTFLDAIDGSYCTYSAFGEAGNDRKDLVQIR